MREGNMDEQATLLQPDESLSPVSSIGKSLIKPGKSQLKIYKRRWYILFLFTALACLINMMWNTWGPIEEPCKAIFGWSDWHILLITSWAALAFISTAVPFIFLMDTKGLRIAVLLAALLMVTGKVIQVIPYSDKTVRTVMLNIGQFIIMAAGPVPISGPPLISATWFPSHERTTATAIATLAGYFGIAMSFTLGPTLVPFSNVTINGTSSYSSDALTLMKTRISDYLWLETGILIALFLLLLVYFPSKPPLPPSVSSSTSHLSGKKGFSALLKNHSFWILAVLCGLSFGIYYGWLSVLDVVLAKFNVDQETAGWLGCGGTLAGIASGILLARFADLIKHKTKQILVFLLTCTTCAQLVFTLSCLKVLPTTNAILYTSVIASGLFYNGSLPLFFELAMECVYPVAEGLTGGILITVGNVVLLFFYAAFMLPQSNVSWMNWVTVAGIGISVPGLMIYREKYTRLSLDSSKDLEVSDKSLKSV